MLSTLKKKYQSSVTLANVAEIVTNVIKEIAGNDISNSLNGSKITKDVIQSLVMQRIDKAKKV